MKKTDDLDSSAADQSREGTLTISGIHGIFKDGPLRRCGLIKK